jgi:hypothetical protein
MKHAAVVLVVATAVLVFAGVFALMAFDGGRRVLAANYSDESVAALAHQQVNADVASGDARLLEVLSNPHEYGSLVLPGVEPSMEECLRQRVQTAHVNTVYRVANDYKDLPNARAPYRVHLEFAKSYNEAALQALPELVDQCIPAP